MKWSYFLFLFVLISSSCLKHDFDEPPVVIHDIGFAPNSSIAELKSKYIPGQFVTISDDLLIHAVVVADDRSGNFYKTIVIQDSTGGIELKINRSGLYTDYPVGMKIGLKCKGLTIGDYNSLVQIGLGTYKDGAFTNLSGIESALVHQYVYKGPKNQAVIPHKRTILTLTAQDLSTLIELDDVEFIRSDTGKTYADVVGQASLNLNLTDCSDNKIILRTSNFADFASSIVPSQNGSIRGILSRFKTDIQLYIRDLSDVQFNNVTCDGGTGGVLDLITIKDVRALYSGTTINLPASKKILGSVISDINYKNTSSQNLYIQDQSGGVLVRFKAAHSFALGDQLEVDISKQELSDFNGLLQINNVDLSRAKKIGTSLINPVPKTIAGILNDFENLESTLVQIDRVTINKSSGSTYSGSCTLTDSTGSIELYTNSSATFANENFPIGTVSLVGIVTQGGTGKIKEISIRNTTDIRGGGGGIPELISLKDIRSSFAGVLTNIAPNKKIRAVVISDKDNMNTTTKNIHIQDATGGIVVRFTADHSFALGDELEINVSGQELSEFGGLLQINSVPLANAIKIGTNTIIPAKKNLAQILADFENLESTLVEVENIFISKSSGSIYSGTCILNDGTATMDLFTRSQASFANTNFQTAKVKLVAFVNQGGTGNVKQLSIRSLADVTP